MAIEQVEATSTSTQLIATPTAEVKNLDGGQDDDDNFVDQWCHL